MRRLMCSVFEQFADGCSALCWGGTNSQINLTLAPLCCPEWGCHVLFSHMHYAMSFFQMVFLFCVFVRDEQSRPFFEKLFSHITFTTRVHCGVINVWVAVLLHPCCMILSWPQLSFRISALLWCVFSICSIFMPLVSLEGSLCVCVWACPHMPMDFNDGS